MVSKQKRMGNSDLFPGCTREEAPPLDPERVQKAISAHPETGETMQVERNGDEGAFRVLSNSSGNVYQVTLEPVLSCDCPDQLYRLEQSGCCKHICAALLVAEDEEAREIARRFVG